MAEQFMKDNNLDFYMETSAKTGFNAKNVNYLLIQVLIEAAKLLYTDYIKYKDRPSRNNSMDDSFRQYNPNIKLPSTGQLNIEQNKPKKKGCDC